MNTCSQSRCAGACDRRRKLEARYTLRQERGYELVNRPAIKTLPLLAGQESLYLTQATRPNDPSYSMIERVDISGPVDPGLMWEACRQVEAETEALRLRFTRGERGPVQVIEGRADSTLKYFDLTSEPDAMAALSAWIETDKACPVSIVDGDLCFAALFEIANDHFVLYRRAHCAVIDQWSLTRIRNRTAAVYSALVEGRTVDEAGAFLPFKRLVDDEASYRESKRFLLDREYWLGLLRDLPEPVALSGRSFARSSDVQRHSAELGTQRVHEMLRASERLGVDWTSLVIGAMTAYLGRLTGSHDLILGMSVDARSSDADRLIPGMVANVLPLRLTVSSSESLAEFFQRVERVKQDMFLHRRYRSEEVFRALGLDGAAYSFWGPVLNFAVCDQLLSFAGHRATVRDLSPVATNDLVVTLCQTFADGGLEIHFDSNPGTYESDEVEAHIRRFLFFLDSINAAEVGSELGRVALVNKSERIALLAWGTGPTRECAQTSVPGLFESWVKRTPDVSALEFEHSTLSYSELNARSNRLARYLAGQGVGKGDLVAFMLPRSIDLVVAVLGILKTGAAFVPLDPSYPASRISFMASDADPTVVLLNSITAGLGNALGRPGIVLDDAVVNRALCSLPEGDLVDEDRKGPILPDSPAYIIYTSGSTGSPKGVIIAHRGVVNVAAAMVDKLGAGPSSRTLQFASSSFDAFVGEMTQSVLNGGTLVGARAERMVPGQDLAELVASVGVNDLVLPPSALDVMSPEQLPVGTTVSVVGEECPSRIVELWSGRCRLFNGYGPTETTISTAMAGPLGAVTTSPIPIGTPLRNVRTYVLDECRQLTPPGAVGELYIGGAGVSLGYLNRKALNAERFVPDFIHEGHTMYRTGDLVRWTCEGQLVFVGRDDDQIKLRGFRIELGEVEAAIARCPGVARAVAMVRGGGLADRQLVGYVVAENNADLHPEGLRRQVGAKLPAYMTPNLLVVVDDLPLTPNGKVDRNALPDTVPVVSPRGRIPGTALEETLLRLFAEILGVPHIGIDDNFFAMGGHSLTAIRLIGGINAYTGLELSVRELVAAPTVAGLAEMLESRSGGGLGQSRRAGPARGFYSTL